MRQILVQLWDGYEDIQDDELTEDEAREAIKALNDKIDHIKYDILGYNLNE